MTSSKSHQSQNLHFLHHPKNPQQPEPHPKNNQTQNSECFLPGAALAHRDGMFWIHRCQVSLFIPVSRILTPVCSHAPKPGPGQHTTLLVTPVSWCTFLHQVFPGLNKPAHLLLAIADQYFWFAVNSQQPRTPMGRRGTWV